MIDLLLALSLKFFLFDFILFKKQRDFLSKKHYVFRKLFCCTYCQGFWCGLLTSLASSAGPMQNYLKLAFVSAIVTFTWSVVMDPLIREFEKGRDLPMT